MRKTRQNKPNEMKRCDAMRDEMSQKTDKNLDQETTQFLQSFRSIFLMYIYIYFYIHEIEAATCEIGNVFYTLANF